jgi:predicted RNA-binding protein YlxR (DUF448 family)
VRLVLRPGGEVAVDGQGGAPGRGAHVHARPACIEKACARGLARSAKARVDRLATASGLEALSAVALAREVRAVLDARVEALLMTAARAGHVALGAEEVARAAARGEARSVVVACDAPAEAGLPDVRDAVREGRAVAWGTRARIAALRLRGKASAGGGGDGADVGVLSISSTSIAAAVRDAARVADACAVISVNVVERGA